MQRKHQKDQSTIDSHKSTPSKKSKTKSARNSKDHKISIAKLSHALYSKNPSRSLKKIIFYDQFQAEDSQIDGAMTSRYLPVQTEGQVLSRCQKVNDLKSRRETPVKKRVKGEGEKRLGEGRGRVKERKMHKNLQRMNMDQNVSGLTVTSVRDRQL